MSANGGGFSEDQSPEQEAQARCTEAAAQGLNTSGAIIPAAPGTQYCFTTSDNRVAWMRVKDASLSSLDSASVVLTVRTWQP